LKEGNKIDVLFVSTDDKEEYSFLQFNDSQNQLNTIVTTNPISQEGLEKAVVLSNAVNF